MLQEQDAAKGKVENRARLWSSVFTERVVPAENSYRTDSNTRN